VSDQRAADGGTRVRIVIDAELLALAASALGTTDATDTVNAALREVAGRRRRRWLSRRDLSELDQLARR
jgi:Arc/MetJ family transcription regulator